MESLHLSRSIGLLNLPNEILSLILGHFCLHCRGPHVIPQAFFPSTGQERLEPSWYSLDCQALHSVCLVSSRLREIAQPILYHQFAPGYGDSWHSILYEWRLRLVRFLRTVARRPDLAAQVRHFHLSHYLTKGTGDGEDAVVEATAALEDASRALGVQLPDFLDPFQELWPSTVLPEYRPVGMEPAAMLLACLPNLTHLSITAMPYMWQIPMPALSASGVSTLPIQTLDIYGGTSKAFTNVILELAASHLRTLNIDAHDGADLRDLARSFPNLRNVCFSSTRLDGENQLGFFLSHITCMESFAYEAVHVHGNGAFLPHDAIKQLLRHKPTLKRLHLDLRMRDHNALYPSTADLTDLMPQLACFSVLQHLFLNTMLVFSSSSQDEPGPPPHDDQEALTRLLPPSIVSLRLADNHAASDTGIAARLGRALAGLARAVMQRRFPTLRTVRCDTGQRVDDDVEFWCLLDGAGVQFEYGSWPFSDGKPRRQRAGSHSSSSSEGDYAGD